MKGTETPRWLDLLIGGQLTADLDEQLAQVPASDHRGSRAIAEVACIAALAGRACGSQLHVVDPTVGYGLMLATLSRALRQSGVLVHALGVDISAEAARTAEHSLASSADSFAVKNGNVLTADLLPSRSAELVVYEPPWGVGWRHEQPAIIERAAEGWYPFGLGRASDAGWLFHQRALSALRPSAEGGGRLVTFLNEGLLRDVSGRDARRSLVENDLLEAIVRLPAGLVENAGLPISLLLLRSDKPERLRGKAHVVDLRPYMTTEARGARRRVSPEGLRTLWSALETRRPGPSNRLVDVSDLARRTVRVSPVGREDLAWSAEVADADIDREVQRRYGSISVGWTALGDSTISFDIEPHFPAARYGSGREKPSTTRLSALLAAPPAVYSAAGGDVVDGEDSLYVPTGAGAAVTTPPTVAGRVLHFRVNPDIIHPEYLSGWLSSDDGKSSLASALDRAASGSVVRAVRSDPRSIWKLADELVVPLRPLAAQREFANALLALRRVENLVKEARADLWTGTQQADLVTGPFDSLLDQSLERWTASLPYPFATALWTLTSRNSVEARHRQIFHTWESYAAFLATVLLSALRQDDDLANVEGAALRRALAGGGLSLERPSFGTWNAVIQRLASRFRSMLESGDEERIRVSSLFGGPRPGVLAAVLNPDCVRLLVEVNNRRNLWLGHSGATSETALQTQIDYLTNGLEELRGLVGEAWTRMPLVRAGKATRRRGELTQEVEAVMGTNVPFRPDLIRVGEMMDEGELYIATDGCARPLPLSHLIVLRSSPSSERHACYFFNRVEGDSVRLVSYQLTRTGQLHEPRAEYDHDLSWLLAP